MVKAVDVGMVTHRVGMVVIASFAEANIHLDNALFMASGATNVMVKPFWLSVQISGQVTETE